MLPDPLLELAEAGVPARQRLVVEGVLVIARVRRDIRFAGDVSHQLRSPLTTTANAAAVLERRRDELSGTAAGSPAAFARRLPRDPAAWLDPTATTSVVSPRPSPGDDHEPIISRSAGRGRDGRDRRTRW